MKRNPGLHLAWLGLSPGFRARHRLDRAAAVRFSTILCVFGLLGVGQGQVIEGGLPLEHDSVIALPAPQLRGELSVEEALHARRSVREYADTALTLAEVSQVLWAAYGITRPLPSGPGFMRGGLRTAPSAGATYPLELYLVAGLVEGLAPGVYRYDSRRHGLRPVAAGDVRADLAGAALGQKFISAAPVSIVYSAVFARTTGKYGERGRDRYVCMDVGHSAENVYLQCAALGLGTCAIGAFDDAAVKRVVGMPNPEEPLYIMPVGRLPVGE